MADLRRLGGRVLHAWVGPVIRREARRQGWGPDELRRFDALLASFLRLRPPEYQLPDQRPPGYMPGLAAQPWPDPARFPWARQLETSAAEIRQEMEVAVSAVAPRSQPQGLVDRGAWDVVYFSDWGRWFPDSGRRCPRTAEILRRIPGAGEAGRVYFSILRPGTHLVPHCGLMNTRLRCHLGLVVPDGCRLRVGREVRAWQEGRCLFFDDSFEHEAWNESVKTRVVLLIDFWHPDLTEAERWAVAAMVRRLRAIRVFSVHDRLVRGLLRSRFARRRARCRG